MDSLSRLIRAALFVVACFWSMSASAVTVIDSSLWLQGGVDRGSAEAQCQADWTANAASYTAYNYVGAVLSGSAPLRTNKCMGTFKSSGAAAVLNQFSELCPSGDSADTTNHRCTHSATSCPFGTLVDGGGVCQLPAVVACAQATLSDKYLGPFASKSTALAYAKSQSCEGVPGGGCVHLYTGTMVSQAWSSGSAAGQYYLTVHETTTGANCTPQGQGPVPVSGTAPTDSPVPAAPFPAASSGSASNPADSPSDSPCSVASKLCPGTVNGAAVCVACQSTSTTSTAGAGSGATSTGPSTTASSPAGTVAGTSSTTKDVTCANGTCTTTVTNITNNSNGTTTTQTNTSTQDQGTFCAGSPGDPQCGDNKSSFSGSCSATTCKGDAIQCQIAAEQARRGCQLLDGAPPNDPAVVAAGAGLHPSDHPWSTATTTPLGSFDQTNLVVGSCPPDLSVAVSHFRAVSIPFSQLCGPAGWLGNVLLGITALACLGIVFVRGS